MLGAGERSVHGRRRKLSPTRRVVKHVLAIPNLEPISAVHGFDIENILGRQPQHATHRCCHVLVHAIGKLDHHDRAFAWCSHQAPTHGSRSTSKFPKYNLHSYYPSSRVQGLHLTLDYAFTYVPFATFPSTVQAGLWFMQDLQYVRFRRDCRVSLVNSASYPR